MKKLSEYTIEEQETIISNFMDDEYGNDEYDSDAAIFHFKEDVDEFLDEMTEMSGDNNLELEVTDFENNMWEIYGEIGLVDENENRYVEAAIRPSSSIGGMEVEYEFGNILFSGSEDMSYGELAEKQADIESEYDWPLMRLVDDINASAEEYGYKAAYGCDIFDKESVRTFLEDNKHGIDLNDYLY